MCGPALTLVLIFMAFTSFHDLEFGGLIGERTRLRFDDDRWPGLDFGFDFHGVQLLS